MADVQAWDALVDKTVVFACQGRSYFAVAEEPRGWSIDLGEWREWSANKKIYRSVWVAAASRTLLQEIAASEDFERGFLTLVFLPKYQEAALADFMEIQRLGDALGIELLRRGGDGQVLDWHKPSRTSEELDQHLTHLLEITVWHDANWQCDQ